MAWLLYLLSLYIFIISPYWDYSCLTSEMYPILDDNYLAIVLILATKTCNKLEYKKKQYFSTISVRGIRSKANSGKYDIDLPAAGRERRSRALKI